MHSQRETLKAMGGKTGISLALFQPHFLEHRSGRSFQITADNKDFTGTHAGARVVSPNTRVARFGMLKRNCADSFTKAGLYDGSNVRGQLKRHECPCFR